MRSEVTAEVLDKAAKRLGYEFIERTRDDKWGGLPIGGRYWQYVGSGSDGDLLLAILNKAAEIGHMPSLSKNPPTDRLPWDCEMGGYAGKQAVLGQGDPLTAAMLAFAQLPEVP